MLINLKGLKFRSKILRKNLLLALIQLALKVTVELLGIVQLIFMAAEVKIRYFKNQIRAHFSCASRL